MKNRIKTLKSRSYLGIERLARRSRRRLGFSQTEPIDAMLLWEAIDGHTVQDNDGSPYKVEYGVDFLDCEGFTKVEKGTVVVALDDKEYRALERGQSRPKFTVAHELGHAEMHVRELQMLNQGLGNALLRGGPDPEIYQNSEWQANAFAGAFLIPARALALLEAEGRLAAKEISRHFGVSLSCAKTRLKIYQRRRATLLDLGPTERKS